jgi:hypothetical protein
VTTQQREVETSQDELSAKLGSVPVVMVCFNGLTRKELPHGVEIVDEYSPDQKPEGQHGRLILKEKAIEHKQTLRLLSNYGFRPVRVLAVLRQNGRFKVVIVCPHWKHADKNAKPISGFLKRGVEAMLNRYWDTRIYRNPSTSGGNFILDLGNPDPMGYRTIGVNEAEEFEVSDGGRSEAGLRQSIHESASIL